MKVLILGGCGFIGKHLVEALKNDDIPLVVFDRNATSEQSSPICMYVTGKFSDHEKLEAVMLQEGITHVVHLVSTTLPKSSNEDKPYDLSSNVIQSIHLLDLCVKYQVKKILFMSSGGTIYGVPRTVPVNENHPNEPICSYGISKLAIEKYLFLYRHLHGLNYVALRAANPYGAGQNPFSGQGVIANFIHKMQNHEPLEIWGDGSTIRDYFDVKDLATLTKLALLSSDTGIFNAGSGTGISINGLIETLSGITGIQPEIIYKTQRNLDVPAIILDCNAAYATFGWKPSIALDAGLANYIQWYKENYISHNIQ